MRVLVIRFSSLGDCVLLCPLLAHLKRAGAAEVVVLTKRAYADVFAHAEGVDRVLAIEPGTSLLGLARIGRSFRQGARPGDVVIDAHSNPRSRIVSAAAGGAHARFRKYYRERAGLIVFKRPASLPPILAQYAALAEQAGFGATTLLPGGLRIPRAESETASLRVGGDQPAVAVAPGSRWRAKRWGGFAALCDGLVAAGRRVVLVGDARDREFTAPIAASLGSHCVDAAGQTTLIQTAALIARCESFVGNDSGLMHLAEAVGVPVTALFGPTVREFGYAPSLLPSTTIERRLACRPCSRNGAAPCPKRTYECLDGIRVDDVLHTVLRPGPGERHRVVD
ncbi:MAG TPA: glycosyltransferase family 9 protein [Candidatus Krumholzibacteria bacterium]|nr:glycosyltransferase family 9 protein [Candidatus Krumholzibacteria bacterium]